MFWRSISGTVGFTCTIFGTPMISLVAQQTIFNTAPFWASLLGWCFLKERISPFEICAMAFSFTGICIIATSKQITAVEDAEQQDDDSSVFKVVLGSGLMFMAAWQFATQFILTR